MSKEAIEHYEAALKEAFPSGATGDVFYHWNEARKARAEQPAQLDSLALNAAIGYIMRHTPKLVHDEICKALRRPVMGASLQPAQQEPCKACNGTGEIETGIGMMVCDECQGTTYTSPPAERKKD
jgi:hypothetical protein